MCLWDGRSPPTAQVSWNFTPSLCEPGGREACRARVHVSGSLTPICLIVCVPPPSLHSLVKFPSGPCLFCACARGCVWPPPQALASLTSSLWFPHSLFSLCLRWSLPFISSFAHSKNRASFFSKLSASNTNYVITIVIRKSCGSYNHSHHQSNAGVRGLLSVAVLSHVLGKRVVCACVCVCVSVRPSLGFPGCLSFFPFSILFLPWRLLEFHSGCSCCEHKKWACVCACWGQYM